jgi:Na+-driven multidrug efflux pump
VVDHVLVGRLVGYTANAGIGVAFQIFLVVMVFIASIFTGMGVLIARYTGAGDESAVNRTTVQAFITAVALCLGFLAPVGYFLAPHLLGIVNAAPEVQAQALPVSADHVRVRPRDDAVLHAGRRAPLRRRRPHAAQSSGVALTALNIALNVILIRGLGPIPASAPREPRSAR